MVCCSLAPIARTGIGALAGAALPADGKSRHHRRMIGGGDCPADRVLDGVPLDRPNGSRAIFKRGDGAF
jgi:hypothetical protein